MSFDSLLKAHSKVESIHSQHLPFDSFYFPAALHYDLSYKGIFTINHFGETALPSWPVEKETLYLAKIKHILDQGKEVLNFIYSYRNYGKIIAQLSIPNENKSQYYMDIYGILKPAVTKMMAMVTFLDAAMATFNEVAAFFSEALLSETTLRPSTEFAYAMGEMLSIFIVLDYLKSMKPCLNNDFSFYKRTLTNVNTENLTSEDIQQNQNLYFFLGSRDPCIAKLKDTLAKNGGVDFLCMLLNMYQENYEKNKYVLPETKYMLLQSMSLLIYLIDTYVTTEKEILKKRKIKVDKILKYLRTTPYVPVLGEGVITLYSFYGRSNSFKQQEQPSSTIIPSGTQHGNMLIQELPSFRTESNELFCLLKIKLLEIESNDENKFTSCQEIYSIIQRMVLLLSRCSCCLREQFAWKFSNPLVYDPEKKNCPENAVVYEQAVRYQFEDEEKIASIELISIIKELASIIRSANPLIVSQIENAVYSKLQQFVQQLSEDSFAFLKKKNQSATPSLKEFLTDWETMSEAATKRNWKQFPRHCSLSQTQIYWLRATLETMNSGEKSKRFLMKSKEKSSKDQTEISFVDFLFFVPYMLQLSEAVTNCSSFEGLWFRELYIELNKLIQISSDSSIPGILLNYCMNDQNPFNMEYSFFVFDIYNDAANASLRNLFVQHLFDEVIGECSLIFEQFLYKLSKKIFIHYKTQASRIYYSKGCKSEETRLLDLNNFYRYDKVVPNYSFDNVLNHKGIMLLGKYVPLSNLFGQALSYHMKTSINTIISRFENSELSYIVELDVLMSLSQITHELISEHIPLEPFDKIFDQVNLSQSLCTPNGRILSHVVSEIRKDLIPHFSYDFILEKFSRAPVIFQNFTPKKPSVKTNPAFLYGSKYYQYIYSSNYLSDINFVGRRHFELIYNYVEQWGMAVIINQLYRHLVLVVKNSLPERILNVRNLIIEDFDDISFENIKENIDAFQSLKAKLTSVYQYDEFKTYVLQGFREAGNVICIVQLIDGAMNLIDLQSHRFSSTLFGPSDDPDVVKQPEYASFLTQNMDSRDNDNWMLPQTFSLYTPPTKLQIIEQFTSRVKELLDGLRDAWKEDGTPFNGGNYQLSTQKSFCKLWSTIQMLVCYSNVWFGDGELRDVFGSGINFCGCMFIHSWNQRKDFECTDPMYRLLQYIQTAAINGIINSSVTGAGGISGGQSGISTILSNLYSPLATSATTSAGGFLSNYITSTGLEFLNIARIQTEINARILDLFETITSG